MNILSKNEHGKDVSKHSSNGQSDKGDEDMKSQSSQSRNESNHSTSKDKKKKKKNKKKNKGGKDGERSNSAVSMGSNTSDMLSNKDMSIDGGDQLDDEYVSDDGMVKAEKPNKVASSPVEIKAKESVQEKSQIKDNVAKEQDGSAKVKEDTEVEYIDEIIAKLLSVQNKTPGTLVQMPIDMIHYVIQRAQEVMMSQPMLLRISA